MSENTISSLVSSLLPLLVTILFAWLGNRNERSKRRQMIDDAKQRIELLNTYVASLNLVTSDPDELETNKRSVAEELYDIKKILNNRLQSLDKASEKSDNYILRFFLLYKMKTRTAKFFRVCFFVALLFSVLWATTISEVVFSNTESIFMLVVGILGFIILGAMPSLLIILSLRLFAIKYDQQANSV